MAVLKAVVRGLVLAVLATASAQAGSILWLGVSSAGEPLVPAGSVRAQASVASTSGSLLTLGVFDESAPLSSTPSLSPLSSKPAHPSISPPPGLSPVPASPGPVGYDAFINLGQTPYPDSAILTSGNPQPWYLGTAVQKLFGGLPTIPQAVVFDQTVLQLVEQSFNLSGVPVSLTLNPNAPAAHTISVVSQSSNPTLPSALGMTYIGGNGFQ
jgi:hypothetical protein